MNTQPPSLGRIVLYRPVDGAADKKARPAMIVDILGGEDKNDRVQLQVFTPSGDQYVSAEWSEQGGKGTWFWPPKVELRPARLDLPDEPPPETKVDADEDAIAKATSDFCP